MFYSVVGWLIVRTYIAAVAPVACFAIDAVVCWLCAPGLMHIVSYLLLRAGNDGSQKRQKICFNSGLAIETVAVLIDKVNQLIPLNPFTYGSSSRQVFVGTFLHALERHDEAGEYLKNFVKSYKSERDGSGVALSNAMMILAEIAMHDGSYGEAKEYADASLRMIEASSKDAVKKGAALADLCASYMKLGLIEDSINIGLSSVSAFDSANPMHNQLQAIAYNNLGLAYSYAGNYVEAHNCAKRSFNLKTTQAGGNNVSHAVAHVNLSESFLMLESYEDALTEAQLAHTILDKLGFKDNLIRATAAQNAGAALTGLGRLEEAKLELQNALDSKKKYMAAKDPDWYSLYLDLAKMHAALKDAGKAENYFRDGLEKVRTLGEKHPRTAYCAGEYAKFLETNNRQSEADALRKKYMSTTVLLAKDASDSSAESA